MSTHYASSTIPKAKKKSSSGRPPAPPPRLSSLTGDGEETTDTDTASEVPKSAPPTIPPKPSTTLHSSKSLERQPMTVPRVSVDHSSAKDEKSQPPLSGSMSLKDLVEKHWKSFPFRIQVEEGYSGQSSQLNISTADVYNLHFLKNQDAVLLKDPMGTVYGIPLYSSIQFSIIHKCEEEISQKGSSKSSDAGKEPKDTYTTTFTKVSDITALKSLPKVVCVTKPYSSENTTLSKNELLVIRSVQKTKKKKSLKVFSLSDHAEKVLPNECNAQFSTDPLLTKLYLPDLMNYVPEIFPSKVLLHLGDNFTLSSAMQQQYMQSSLLTEAVTIVGKKRERTLVASAFFDDINEMPDDLLDIPLNQEFISDVEVAVMDIHGEELEKLQETTRALMKSMVPSNLKTYQDAASDSIYSVQALLYSRYHPGNERRGMEIQLPLMQKLVMRNDVQPASDEDDGNEYATIDESLVRKRHENQQTNTSLKPQSFSASNLYQMPKTNPGDARSLSPVPLTSYSAVKRDHQPLPQDNSDLYSTPRLLPSTRSLQQSESCSGPLRGDTSYDVPPNKGYPNKPTRGEGWTAQQYALTHPRRKRSPATRIMAHLQREPSEDYEDMKSFLPSAHPLKRSTSSENILDSQSINQGYGVFDRLPLEHSVLTQVQKKVSMLEQELKDLGERVGASVNMAELKDTLDEVLKRLAALEQKVSDDSKGAAMSKNDSVETIGEANEASENKLKLQQLTSTQVVMVLEGMGLGQYGESFERESIDGEVLSALDDSIIRDELGVASKIHRIRIIKLIDGLYSSNQFLSPTVVT